MDKVAVETMEHHYAISVLMAVGVGVCFGVLISRYRSAPICKALKNETLAGVAKGVAAEPFASVNEKFKAVFAVRQDLKMTPGKVAAQCSHAAIGMYRKAIDKQPYAAKRWEKNGQPKICLKVPDETQMYELERAAREKGLITTIIHDAGHTQVEAGTATVLGVGPGPASVVDSVTGSLRLY